MKHEELVTLGRKYANGDGVMIDTERALELWSLVRQELEGEDLRLYQEICACHTLMEPQPQLSVQYALSTSPLSDRSALTSINMAAATQRSEAEVRNTFENILQNADSATLTRLYEALRRVEEGAQKEPKARKPENIRFGNNLGFIMRQFGWNRTVFLGKMNARLQQISTYHKRQSSSSLSQIINGINGMDGTAQMVLVAIINHANKEHQSRWGHPILHRSMTVADLHLFPVDLAALFVNPKLDDERIKQIFAPHS